MNKMKFIRISNELNQTELAKEIGIPRQVYTLIEGGRLLPTLAQIKKIEKVFKIDIETLLKEDHSSPLLAVKHKPRDNNQNEA